MRWSIPQASIGWDPSHPLGGSSRLLRSWANATRRVKKSDLQLSTFGERSTRTVTEEPTAPILEPVGSISRQA